MTVANLSAQSMAKVRLWMFRVAFPAPPKVVYQRSHHPFVPPIRLGRRYPPSLEDLRSRLHLLVLRHRLCSFLVSAQLGPRRSLQ